jgi:deazaflavin-dependent oxidoreductase (nitroreductase family)
MAGKLTVFFDRTVGRNSYRVHRFLYRHTRGFVGHWSPNGPMLLLTTTGRKSGLQRTTPLLYMADGSRYVVVASNGGRAEPPAWLLNLETKPDAQIQVGRRVMTATAVILDADDKASIWPRLVEQHRGRSRYETLTDRDLKVVALVPVSDSA